MNNNVVVTGIGVLSPIGIGRAAFWDALFQGTTGFMEVSLFDTSHLNVHIAGEISDFDAIPFLGKKGLRTLDRTTKLLCSAAALALEDSVLHITEDNAGSVGVSVGTTFGSLHSISQFDREALTEGPRYVNPSLFPNTVINSPASQVSIRFKIRGFNTTISTGFCASLDAVSYAADFIRLGRTEVVLAGGVEELCEETFLAFYKLGYLSGSDGSPPHCCPFDSRSNGTILSEGAALLLLEDKRHALGRKANVLAEIAGYGNSFDPSPEKAFGNSRDGLRNAMALALEDASLSPRDIDCIFSCANSTKALDRLETDTIRDLFAEYAFDVPITAIKSMVGETFSASGALSLTAATGAIINGKVPPTVNHMQKARGCDLDYVPAKARHAEIRNALVISTDPYGNNTAMVITKHKP